MRNLFLIIMCSALLLGLGTVYAENQGTIHTLQLPVPSVQLKPGTGLDKVSTLCNICHSTDYITMQPKFPRGTWTAEVNKMIKVMGAPINDEDAKTIIDYLAANYGSGK